MDAAGAAGRCHRPQAGAAAATPSRTTTWRPPGRIPATRMWPVTGGDSPISPPGRWGGSPGAALPRPLRRPADTPPAAVTPYRRCRKAPAVVIDGRQRQRTSPWKPGGHRRSFSRSPPAPPRPRERLWVVSLWKKNT